MPPARPSVVVLVPDPTKDERGLHGMPTRRLMQQLDALARDVRFVLDHSATGWDEVADAIADSTGPVGLVDATFVGHTSPLGDTIADPRRGSALLMDGAGFHGVLRIGAADRGAALTAARALAAGGVPVGASELAERLIESGVDLLPVDPGPYTAGFARDAAAAGRLLERVNGTDEHRLRLGASARPGDGFYSTFVVRRVSRQVTALAVRSRVAPNRITAVSLLVGLVAAVMFGVGATWAVVAGAVLLQVSLVLDCVDGEVARYTRKFSVFGAWLDAVADRVKEFAAYAGLAIGAARSGQQIWLLAGAALALLVVRHHVDFGFAVRQEGRRPGLGDTNPAVSRAARLSDRTNRRAALRWAKKVVIMPIGERWLVISVVAPLWGARAVFVVLLVTGTVAAVYTTLGRVLRSLSERIVVAERGRRDLAVLTELPLLVPVSAPPHWLGLRLGWLVPAASRVVEYVTVLALAAALGNAAVIAAYALLSIVALHLYDLVYRLRHLRLPPPHWASVAVLGAALRPGLLVLAAFAGPTAFVATCATLAAVILAGSLVDGRSAWITAASPAISPEYAEVPAG